MAVLPDQSLLAGASGNTQPTGWEEVEELSDKMGQIGEEQEPTASERLAIFDPDSDEHKAKVYAEIEFCQERFRIDEAKELKNTNIKNINIDDLSYDKLERICFHYSAKNNGNSIDMNGIRSGIGDNSAGIDKNEAIYFSYGIEGVLHTWDVWLKWRLGRLYAPDMQGDPEIQSQQEADEYSGYCKKWKEEVLSGDYKQDADKLSALFRYQEAELRGSDYLMLDLSEGVDFSFDTIDPKKARVRGNPYEEIKFGAGISTDLSHDRVENWNMFTPLGERKVLSPDRIKRLTLDNGANDVNSILMALYDKYQEHCKDTGEDPVQFDLLDTYIEWSKGR